MAAKARELKDGLFLSPNYDLISIFFVQVHTYFDLVMWYLFPGEVRLDFFLLYSQVLKPQSS